MVDYIQGVILVLFEALICSAFLSSFLQRKHREIRWQMLEVASLAGLYLISAAHHILFKIAPDKGRWTGACSDTGCRHILSM